MKNIDKAETLEAKTVTSLPADVAHNYIREMLAELTAIAEAAQLTDLTALLNVTLKAVDISAV